MLFSFQMKHLPPPPPPPQERKLFEEHLTMVLTYLFFWWDTQNWLSYREAVLLKNKDTYVTCLLVAALFVLPVLKQKYNVIKKIGDKRTKCAVWMFKKYIEYLKRFENIICTSINPHRKGCSVICNPYGEFLNWWCFWGVTWKC